MPTLADFQDRYIFQGTHPIRVLDYRLFAQEMFNRWVLTLSETVRSNGNPNQLITVGQDEGGIGERPNPHFFADVVDFTTNHTWWQNDDLLWDSIMTKTPNKPNVSQETGIMFVENVDGSARRTLEDCSQLLARKLALSFAGGCAGFIQWLWNTNIYMDDDNEVGIGLHHADGTEKPELQAFRDIAQFFQQNAKYMQNRKLEEVCIVIPHSNMFSVRDTANTSTRRTIRSLEYGVGVATRTVSEYRMENIGDPKLIILPSPRVLNQKCWEVLLEKVEKGASLLVTGPIESDEYWRDTPRLQQFGITSKIQPVSQQEFVEFPEGSNMYLRFAGDGIQKLDCSVTEERSELAMQIVSHGSGKIYLYPLPIDMTTQSGFSFYRKMTRETLGDAEHFFNPELLLRQVEFEEHTLYIILNEGNSSGRRMKEMQESALGEAGIEAPLQPGSIALAIMHRETGEVVSLYRSGDAK